MPEYIKLPADLPENWQPNQTITPNGVEGGLTEQHGYNYLSKQVNAAQREVNEKLLDPDTNVIAAHNTDPLAHDGILATIGTPEKYPLTLAGDLITFSDCVYYKNAFNEVTVVFEAKLKDNGAVRELILTTLPEGYRPLANTATVVGGNPVSGSPTPFRVAGGATVFPSGAIAIGYGYGDINGVFGTITFSTTPIGGTI